ncbi:hypothetical protein QS422_12100 [Staphylococcus pseudintermedius]|nr:hypothetical protein [Staphylococcus pseudintermedius]WMZ57331.1 hypothetical protein QS422_12100 [Staphylococcus pseudintermedius]
MSQATSNGSTTKEDASTFVSTVDSCRFRPTTEAKRNLIRTLRKITKRNRPGTFKEIITEINHFGTGVTEDEVKGAITIPGYPTDGDQPTITIDDPSQLPSVVKSVHGSMSTSASVSASESTSASTSTSEAVSTEASHLLMSMLMLTHLLIHSLIRVLTSQLIQILMVYHCLIIS